MVGVGDGEEGALFNLSSPFSTKALRIWREGTIQEVD